MKIMFSFVTALGLLLVAGCASRLAQGGSAGEETGGYTTGQSSGQEEMQTPALAGTRAQSGLNNYLETLSNPGPF